MDDRGAMTNLIVQGAQAPAVFTFALVINFLILGAVLATMIVIRQQNTQLYNEVRILQVHVQNQNSVLIRSGLKSPEDDVSGPGGVIPKQSKR